MSHTCHAAPRSNAGFTLIELMIVVVVMGVLAAIAIPLYGDAVMRSKIIGATSGMGDIRTQMEKYFMDNRSYLNGAACGAAPAVVAFNADPSRNFDMACPGPTATTYTIRATGIGARGTGGFIYTINEQNAKATVGVHPGWAGAGSTCWVLRKDGSC